MNINALLGAHAETLLATISAFAEEAPDFEERGVETFECEAIRDGPEIAAARLATTRRMEVKIDGVVFEVVAYAVTA